MRREKDYFDNILKEIDPEIQLDDEQRRAVITDDKYIFKLILFMMKDGYLIVKVNPKNNSVFMDAQITIEIQKNVGTCNPFLMTPYKR